MARKKTDLAAEAWRLVFQLFMSTRPHRDAVLARLHLTPNDSKALSSLAVDAGKPMSALADEWGTDPSNATWVIDRLERLGLAERRASTADRRVKLVVLTAKGKKVRQTILDEFHEPPPQLAALDANELGTLCALLHKLAPAPTPKTPGR